jgi:hypothetical protein
MFSEMNNKNKSTDLKIVLSDTGFSAAKFKSIINVIVIYIFFKK